MPMFFSLEPFPSRLIFDRHIKSPKSKNVFSVFVRVRFSTSGWYVGRFWCGVAQVLDFCVNRKIRGDRHFNLSQAKINQSGSLLTLYSYSDSSNVMKIWDFLISRKIPNLDVWLEITMIHGPWIQCGESKPNPGKILWVTDFGSLVIYAKTEEIILWFSKIQFNVQNILCNGPLEEWIKFFGRDFRADLYFNSWRNIWFIYVLVELCKNHYGLDGFLPNHLTFWFYVSVFISCWICPDTYRTKYFFHWRQV